MSQQTTTQVIQGKASRGIFLEGVTLENLSDKLSPGTIIKVSGSEEIIEENSDRRNIATFTLNRQGNLILVLYKVLEDKAGYVYLHEQFRNENLAQNSQFASKRYRKLQEAEMIQ